MLLAGGVASAYLLVIVGGCGTATSTVGRERITRGEPPGRRGQPVYRFWPVYQR